MSDELHVVTREETFNDYAVRELAQSKAACMCRVQFKRCKAKQCANCYRHTRVANCEAAMSDYDRERLQHYTSVYYTEYSINPTTWMSHKEYKRYYARLMFFILLFLFIMMLIPIVLIGPLDAPNTVIDFDTAITSTIQAAQSQVYDVDRDDKINCIDYAIVFKLVWDTRYPRLKTNCTIIRNVNWLTDMNHLFICINNGYRNIWVEPGTYDPYNYTMESIWGDRYDPICNKYGETQYWLSEVKYD